MTQNIDDIRAQALENVRAARENLGQDTIDRIAELMRAKENSTVERKKAEILEHDASRVAAELLYMLREDGV